MEELFTQVGDLFVKVVTNLTNPEAWKQALSNPAVTSTSWGIMANRDPRLGP